MSSAQLAAAGRSSHQIRAMAERGELLRIGWGYYATADLAELIRALPTGRLLLSAAAAAASLGPSAVVSHQTAALLHELSMLGPPPAALTVTRPPGAGSRSGKPGVRIHCAALPPGHVGGRLGVPVTTVPRTVIDLARVLDFRAGVVVADSALQQKLTSKKELIAVIAACQRWRGVRRAAQVVEFADGGAESPLESLARIVFRDGGLPPPELQVEIRDSEFIGRVDFLWRKFRTIAEVDGAGKYDDRTLAMRQLRRDKRLREAGYEVVHFDWKEINADPGYVVTAVRAAFEQAGRRAKADGP
ncbi:MAG TPA: type IV toxin-antitoxin system AbiEi family antitoxin domain-containing protein [Streptosporangiaceae bacterium]|nr:type IV toxin-antitoxin system AbiEi family antitoxin domain-containing protein [Streptosporangiaceae bacterium]